MSLNDLFCIYRNIYFRYLEMIWRTVFFLNFIICPLLTGFKKPKITLYCICFDLNHWAINVSSVSFVILSPHRGGHCGIKKEREIQMSERPSLLGIAGRHLCQGIDLLYILYSQDSGRNALLFKVALNESEWLEGFSWENESPLNKHIHERQLSTYCRRRWMFAGLQPFNYSGSIL